MSSTLRAVAVASSAALLIGGLATSAGAASPTTTAKAPPQATIGTTSLSTSALTFRKTLTVTGTLVTSATDAAVPGQRAVLQRELNGSDAWQHVPGTPIKHTGNLGLVHWTVSPGKSSGYRVKFLPSAAYAGVIARGLHLKVFPVLTLDKLRSLPARTASDVTGTVSPHVTGAIYLQKLVNGVWKHAATAAVEDGKYSFSVTPASLGALRYRVVFRSDGSLATTVSKPLSLHVVNRDLELGDSGPDVLALQKRLKVLDYDLGSATDTYGYDALHAVTAFEKVQGLPANGEVDTAVWKALNNPKVPHLRHADVHLKYAVEVSLHKQIVMIARYGKVWRILDTSTAGGYLYTNSSGGTSRAVTPTGHFTFQYKITGWHKSSLGELYYPSYFTNTGYAIHGEGNGNDSGEVPPYANSHGCVRITNDAVLRYYYSVFTVGTNVWIY